MTPRETLIALAEYGALFECMDKHHSLHPEYTDEECFEAAIRDPELRSLIEWNYRKQLEAQESAA